MNSTLMEFDLQIILNYVFAITNIFNKWICKG